MKKLYIICPMLLLLLTSGRSWHEFHVSKCVIEYSQDEKSLQISLHLFIDDIEEALRKKGADKLFLCTEKESEKATAYLERYLRQGLQIQVDGKDCNFRFVGKENSNDWTGMWCYLEVPGIAPFRELTLTNVLLTEVFDDQKNLVSVEWPGREKKNLLFYRQKTRQRIVY